MFSARSSQGKNALENDHENIFRWKQMYSEKNGAFHSKFRAWKINKTTYAMVIKRVSNWIYSGKYANCYAWDGKRERAKHNKLRKKIAAFSSVRTILNVRSQLKTMRFSSLMIIYIYIYICVFLSSPMFTIKMAASFVVCSSAIPITRHFCVCVFFFFFHSFNLLE